jgi:hypothetical protein
MCLQDNSEDLMNSSGTSPLLEGLKTRKAWIQRCLNDQNKTLPDQSKSKLLKPDHQLEKRLNFCTCSIRYERLEYKNEKKIRIKRGKSSINYYFLFLIKNLIITWVNSF